MSDERNKDLEKEMLLKLMMEREIAKKKEGGGKDGKDPKDKKKENFTPTETIFVIGLLVTGLGVLFESFFATILGALTLILLGGYKIMKWKSMGPSDLQSMMESMLQNMMSGMQNIKMPELPTSTKRELPDTPNEPLKPNTAPLGILYEVSGEGWRKGTQSLAIGPDDSKHLTTILKRAKILRPEEPDVEIISKEFGPTLQRVVIKLPPTLRPSNFKTNNAHEDIAYFFGAKTVQIVPEEDQMLSFLLPRKDRETVFLKTALYQPEFRQAVEKNALPVCVGIRDTGQTVTMDLAKCPHLLVAGQTGSGKSVWLNQALLGLAMLKTPEEVLFFIGDPKKVEFSIFKEKKLPHVAQVVTEANDIVEMMKRLCDEMDRRNKILEDTGQKNIAAYMKYRETHPEKKLEKLPYIVCLIDEFADVMVFVESQLNGYIQRITAMARAAGIHLILATQRPDKNVVTGIIKVNMPARVCFSVPDRTNYYIVLGIDKDFGLLGHGDGLIKDLNNIKDGGFEPVRFQSPFTGPDELFSDMLEEITAFWQSTGIKPIKVKGFENGLLGPVQPADEPTPQPTASQPPKNEMPKPKTREDLDWSEGLNAEAQQNEDYVDPSRHQDKGKASQVPLRNQQEKQVKIMLPPEEANFGKSDIERIKKYIRTKDACKIQVIRKSIFNKSLGSDGKPKPSIEIYEALKKMRAEEPRVDELFRNYEDMDINKMIDRVIKDFDHLNLTILQELSGKSLDEIFKVFEDLKQKNPYVEELYQKFEQWDVRWLIYKFIDKTDSLPLGIIYHLKFESPEKDSFSNMMNELRDLKSEFPIIDSMLNQYDRLQNKVDNMRWIIAQTGQCPSRSQIQFLVKSGNDTTTKMFKILSEEGWIELHENHNLGYRVIASEEVRKAYLESLN